MTAARKSFTYPMKPHRINASGLLVWLLMFCGFCNARAETKVPCLIFTGASDTEQCFDLEKQNRITFTDAGMIVSSSKDTGIPDVQLPYTLFNHIEVSDAVPTESSGVIDIVSDTYSRLVFDSDTKSVMIKSISETPYSIGIFSVKGTLIAMSEVRAGQSLSVEELVAGVYVAIATGGESKLTLKFIIK